MKKRIAITLVVCLILAMIPAMSFADPISNNQNVQTSFTDVTGHWALEAITKWAGEDVVKGDSKGFRPDDPITRAEMAVILNNLMGYQKKADNIFSDVDNGAWYAGAVLKANAAGVLGGDGAGHATPRANITREQAAVMLARAFGVDNGAADQTSFQDAQNISSWAQPLVFGMESNQYIGGMGNGNFEPRANITRAQVVTMIDNAVKGYYTAPGTYTDDVAPINTGANCVAVIKADGVILKGAKLTGDVIIAEGVGDGNVTLDGTTITGKLLTRGGGKDSIHIINGAQVNGRVSVQRVDGVVRIISDGVTIADLDAETEVILEGSFTNVVIAEGAAVEVKGQVKNISVEAKAILTITKDAKVDTIAVEKEAAGAEVSVSGTVKTVTTDAPKTKIKITDTAKITKVNAAATAEGTNVSMDKKAEVNTLNSDATITTSGKGAPKEITGKGKVSEVTESSGSSGGGGGGGGSSDDDSDTTSPVVTAGQVNRISDTEATVKFTSNEAGSYYYAVVEHNTSEPNIDTSAAGTACTTDEVTINLSSLTAGVKDVYVKVKDAAGNVSNALKIIVPEYETAYQYGLVKAYAKASKCENAKVKLLKTDGVTKTFCYADDFNYKVEESQIIAYTLNEDGDIDKIDTSSKAIYVDAGLTIQSKQTLKINDTAYDIWDQVTIFTYDGDAPGNSDCNYDIYTIDNIKYKELIASPSSVYLDIGGVIAILIPKSAIKVLKPEGLEGVAPTTSANDDGRITGVDSSMEYKLSSDTKYTPITSRIITGLAAGTYDVRYAANGDHGAGPSVAVEVPKCLIADQIGLVKVYKAIDGIDNAKVKLLTSDDATYIYSISDDVDAKVVRGQILAYGVDKFGDIGAMDSTNKTITVDSGLIIRSKKVLQFNNIIYAISNDVAVFTYDGSNPSDKNNTYHGATIDDVETGTISSPASIYLDNENDVVALLIPESEIDTWIPDDLKGIAPTSAANDDGMITGVDSTMEYKLSSDTTYTPITRGVVTGLAAGTYHVRYAAIDNEEAGCAVTVVVPAYVPADQYALVLAFDQGDFYNAKVKLLKSNGEKSTYDISDQLNVELTEGQVISYGANATGMIVTIDSFDEEISDDDSTDESYFKVLSGEKIEIDGETYDISDQAAIFTYDETSDGHISYAIESIADIEKLNIATLYIDGEILVAILAPKSSLK